MTLDTTHYYILLYFVLKILNTQNCLATLNSNCKSNTEHDVKDPHARSEIFNPLCLCNS